MSSWFRLPFLSRSSHEETVSLLREEISELKAERKRTIDYILQASVGRGLFEDVNRPVPVKEVAPSGYFAKPTNEETVEEAPSRRNPRAMLREIQQKVNAAADTMFSEAQTLIRNTVEEGKQAASQS